MKFSASKIIKKLLIGLAVIALLLILFLVHFTFFSEQWHWLLRCPPEYVSVCSSNLRVINYGIELYLKEHGNRFPREWGADPYLWVKDISPYLSKKEPTRYLYCLKDNNHRKPSSYLFNAALTGKKLEEIKNSGEIVLLREDKKRHKIGTNYLFLDGHTEFR